MIALRVLIHLIAILGGIAIVAIPVGLYGSIHHLPVTMTGAVGGAWGGLWSALYSNLFQSRVDRKLTGWLS